MPPDSSEATTRPRGGRNGIRPGPRTVRRGDLIFSRALTAPQPAESAGAEAVAALGRLEDALTDAGGRIDDVVGVTAYVRDLADIETVIEAGRERFTPPFPAWSAVAAGALPEPGARVAIAAIAKAGSEPKRSVTPETIAWRSASASAAGCRKGELIAIGAQAGTDADGNVNVPGDPGAQSRNALNRVAEICTMLGASLGDVIEVVSCHHDAREIDSCGRVYETEFFPGADGSPAWSQIAVPGLLRMGMQAQYQGLAEVGHGIRVSGRLSGHEGGPAVAWKAAGSLVAVAAQGSSPLTGDDGDAERSAREVLARFEETLGASGASLADVAELVSYHADIRLAPACGELLRERFGAGGMPAWTPVGVTGLRGAEHGIAIRGLAVRRS